MATLWVVPGSRGWVLCSAADPGSQSPQMSLMLGYGGAQRRGSILPMLSDTRVTPGFMVWCFTDCDFRSFLVVICVPGQTMLHHSDLMSVHLTLVPRSVPNKDVISAWTSIPTPRWSS